MASNEHSVWRSHCQEAKIEWPGGQRIPWNGEAIGMFLLPCAPPGVPDCERGPDRCNASGAAWASAVSLPPRRNGLIAWRKAVLPTFREASLCRHVHRELLRSVLLDLTPTIAATACNQINYVERYSRHSAGCPVSRHSRWRAAACHRETSGLFPRWAKRAS